VQAPEVVSARTEPHLLFVGFHSTPGRATPESQNELVAGLLAEHGFLVRSGSAEPRQLRRLVDQLVLVVRNLRWADAIVVDVFSGRRSWTPYFVARIARGAGLPMVLVLHGGGLPEFVLRHPRRIDSSLRIASKIVAPSPYLKRAFERRGFAVAEVPNLVDVISSANGERSGSAARILWMRAFDTEYRPELAIEAFSILLEQHPAATMTMAGPDRGLLHLVRRLAEERGVIDRVRFPGYVEGSEKVATLRDHDIFLSTTVVDNTPVSVIEAMAAGLPVVATNVGGISDLLEGGRAGVLVRDGDSSALAEAMLNVLEDDHLRASLVRSGSVVADRFTPEAVLDAWRGLLRVVGVCERVARPEGLEALRISDLDDVVELHLEAFPASAMSELGRKVLRRYYRWQFTGPHPAPVAIGAWHDGRLVGFLFGGLRRGAVSGFARRSMGVIALGALTHPGALRKLALPKVVAVGRALVPSRTARPVRESSVSAHSQGNGAASFGVLSIAVSRSARGSGVAAGLMARAELEARALGCVQMNLTVNPENNRAVRFYEKVGWGRQLDRDGWSGAMIKRLTDEEG